MLKTFQSPVPTVWIVSIVAFVSHNHLLVKTSPLFAWLKQKIASCHSTFVGLFCFLQQFALRGSTECWFHCLFKSECWRSCLFCFCELVCKMCWIRLVITEGTFHLIGFSFGLQSMNFQGLRVSFHFLKSHLDEIRAKHTDLHRNMKWKLKK